MISALPAEDISSRGGLPSASRKIISPVKNYKQSFSKTFLICKAHTRKEYSPRIFPRYERSVGCHVLPNTAQVPTVTAPIRLHSAQVRRILSKSLRYRGYARSSDTLGAHFGILTRLLVRRLVSCSGHLSFEGLQGILILFRA